MHSNTLNEFLNRNNISEEVWEQSGTDWDMLRSIATDHESQLENLRDSAELFARVIQRFKSVHSVRWRVKDTEHLLKKIVRKRSKNRELDNDVPNKYNGITDENYFKIVNDLVGVRALHLFKEDCFSIDRDLRSNWEPIETPTVYIRKGDPQDLTNRFHDQKFDIKPHPSGYRSIHYVFATQPLQRRVFTEIQVRTIFEEGWSEIDHRIRYPNFSNDKLVGYFLDIFNRLAGSADEMGSFVQGLTDELASISLNLNEANHQKEEANRQKEEALSAMEKTLSDLEKHKKEDGETKKQVANLKAEVEKLRKISTHEPSLEDFISKNSLGLGNFKKSLGLLDSEELKKSLGLMGSEELKKSLGLLGSGELKKSLGLLGSGDSEELKKSLGLMGSEELKKIKDF